MKRTRTFLLLLLGLIVVLCGLTAWTVHREHRQERLNRDLIASVKRNDTKAVVSLLNQGADANCHDEPYKPVSWWKLLLDQWKGVKTPPSTANTPLLLALQGTIHPGWPIQSPPENLPLVKALLDHQANVNVRNQIGFTPFRLALASQKEATFRLLLEHGVDLKPNPDEPFVPLEQAVLYSNNGTEFLSDMLQHGANVNEHNSGGYTALDMAVVQGDVEAVRLLLSYHADVMLRAKTHRMDQVGETPLALARIVFNDSHHKEDKAPYVQIIHLLQQAGAQE